VGIDRRGLSSTHGALISDRVRKSIGFARIRILSEEKEADSEMEEKETNKNVSFEVLDYDSDRESSFMTLQRSKNMARRLEGRC
jgi:hypothetical protein